MSAKKPVAGRVWQRACGRLRWGGAVCGASAPAQGRLSAVSDGATVVFALAVLLLSTAAYGPKLSPLLAALTFGIVGLRAPRPPPTTQRNFGTAGDLLGVFCLCMWHRSRALSGLGWPGAGGGAVGGPRWRSMGHCARISGITRRKG